MEAFLAAQALCGGENSDSDSIRSEFSETYGALSYQRRPGSGRRKKQAPWRSPWDASVNTNYAPQYLPQEYAPSRLGIEASTAPASPIVASLPADDATPVSTPNPATPGFKSKKAKQDLSGPCCHCNATTSPQWRKGPKGKPVLCNACGIRFLRTRTLGKAMPKKRRTTAAAGSGDHMGNAQHKRIRADEPSTEEEDLELNADEVMAADDAHIAVDDVLEEGNSGSLNHSSMAFSDLTAAAAAMGHQADHHAYQHPAAALLPISRLAVASSAAGSLHDETGCAETQEFGQYIQLEQQQYTQQLYTEQHYTGSTAGAEFNAAASFVPQFGWPVTSINPLGPNAAAAADTHTTTVNQQALQAAAMRLAAAAAARTGGTTSSSGGDITGHMYLSPATSTGLPKPLAAGSRLLLNAGVTDKVSNSPSLAAALAMQQQQRSCSSDQQQPQSPLALGIYSSSAVAGSPISHQSALQSHLKAEFSGFSYGTGSGPASPLALPPAAAAAATSSGLRHMTLSSNSSGGIYSTFNRMHQQQHGLHGPSPLSVMAAAAAVDVSVAADQLAQPAADAATVAPPRQHTNQQHGDMAAAYESADSGYDSSAAAALDASAATAAAVTNPAVTHLMRLVANALGGMGNTWEILKSLNNSTGTHAAAAAAAGSVDHVSNISRAVHLQQQQQQQYQ